MFEFFSNGSRLSNELNVRKRFLSRIVYPYIINKIFIENVVFTIHRVVELFFFVTLKMFIKNEFLLINFNGNKSLTIRNKKKLS